MENEFLLESFTEELAPTFPELELQPEDFDLGESEVDDESLC
jgi:hypothetical protein